jgi:predicted RNA polymerase sigma factor
MHKNEKSRGVRGDLLYRLGRYEEAGAAFEAADATMSS